MPRSTAMVPPNVGIVGICSEGVVAKQHTRLYRPGKRGWVKVKNRSYWRRDAENEVMERARKRRAAAFNPG